MNTCQPRRGRKLLGALIDLSPDLDTFCGASISVVSPSARPGCASSLSPTEAVQRCSCSPQSHSYATKPWTLENSPGPGCVSLTVSPTG